jgi:hypothetical protein
MFQNQNDSVGKLNKPKVLNSERFSLPMDGIQLRIRQISMKTGRSLYRQRGKPERVMAEIRRMLLRKISARLERDRESMNSLKETASTKRIQLKGSDF